MKLGIVKLGVVSLLRNEADIVVPFVRHLAALFDHAVLMDHGSVDGRPTRAACPRAASPGGGSGRSRTTKCSCARRGAPIRSTWSLLCLVLKEGGGWPPPS